MPPEAAVATDPNATAATTAAADTTASTTAATTTTNDSWAKGWLKEDGTLDHSVFDKAPDDYKGIKKEVERYKTFGDYLKGQKEREAMLGRKGLVEPLPANATAEQVAERSALLRKVNGAPEDAKGYGLTRPEGVPETAWDQKYADSIAAIAHKHGLPPAALKELAATELAYSQAQQKASNDQAQAWYDSQDKLIREALTKEGSDYAKGLELAQRAGRKWGVAPDSPLLKNATVFMLLNRLAKADSEDVIIKGELEGLGLKADLSPAEAEKQADDIQNNKENPLNKAFKDRNDPDHAKARAKWEALLKVAVRDKPQRTARG